jgi:hypothetical protein
MDKEFNNMNDVKNKTDHNIRLTSAEVSCLWAFYMTESISKCILSHFLNNVEDTQIQPVLEYAFSLTEKHLGTITDIFNHEDFPIPYAFTKDDVNINAPRLYSDTFYLYYLKNLGRMQVAANGLAVSMSVRSDVFDFFNESLASTVELLDRARQVLLTKGLFVRPPYITVPKEIDFVEKQKFFAGFFGEKRPLLAIEITHLFSNSMNNIIGKALIMGFSQVAQSQEVRDYFLRGKELAAKQVEVFSSILRKEDIPSPMTWDDSVMASKDSPFSDKLMMYHVTSLTASGIANYGIAVSTNLRSDLGGHYARLTAEILQYAEDGANILINNQWMEQPPRAENRKELTRV